MALRPGGGNFTAFLVPGHMIIILAKICISGFVLARMTLNILIDVLVGSTPIFGDIFDVTFKACEHYIDGFIGRSLETNTANDAIAVIGYRSFNLLSYKIFVWLLN